MADGPVRVETLSELQIWIAGEFRLVAQTQSTANTDLTNVRKTVHDLANQMQVIIALNLPEKLIKLEAADIKHQTSIDKFVLDAAKTSSAIATLKAVYTTAGIAIGSIATIAFELYKAMH